MSMNHYFTLGQTLNQFLITIHFTPQLWWTFKGLEHKKILKWLNGWEKWSLGSVIVETPWILSKDNIQVVLIHGILPWSSGSFPLPTGILIGDFQFQLVQIPLVAFILIHQI